MPAGLLVSHDILVQLMAAIIGGFVSVIGVMIAQAARDRGRERRQLHMAAGTLGIEIAAIAEAIKGNDLARRSIFGTYKMHAVPRGAYDGILGSGVLSRFDLRAQELLYRFYWRASIGDNAGVEAMIDQVAAEVGRVARENAPGPRAALGRTLRRALGGRAEAEGAPRGGTVSGMRGRGRGKDGESAGAPIRGCGL